MNPLFCIAPLSVALFAPPLPAPDVELVFAVEEGVTIALIIEETTEREVISETWWPLYDGERIEEDVETTEGGASWVAEVRSVVVDTYDTVEDGRVTALTRTFESISGDATVEFETEDGIAEEEVEIGSPLQDRTVVFAWDEDDEEYSVSFDEDGDDDVVDAILLDGMLIDTFGAWFLPGDEHTELSEGDEWSSDVGAWNDLLEVGGAFWMDVIDAEPPTEEAADEDVARDAQLRENAEGDIVCTFDGLREVDGVELGVILIAVEITMSFELEATYEEPGFDGEVTTETATEMEISAEGECLWNIETSRPHSIRFEIETTDVTTTLESGSIDGDDFAWESVTETEMSVVLVYRFEQR